MGLEGNAPLWHHTAAPPPETTRLEEALHADVAVVGAGYTGLSCALHLAEGGARVVVLEAGGIGEGASGRNNGQVIPTMSRMEPWQMREDFARLVAGSAAFTFDLIRRHGMDCEAVQNGWVQPAHAQDRLRATERRAREWALLDAPVEMLDAAGVERLTGSRFWHGGWQNRTGGKLNPLAYCRALARAAIGAGAVVYTGSAARAIDRLGLRWRVATAQGSVNAERVVLATNAYSDGLWPGLAKSVFPVRSYQASTVPLPQAARAAVLPQDHACSDTQGDLHFFRWDDGGRLVAGAALASPRDWPARLRARVAARIAKVFPQLGAPAIEHGWHGHVGVTLDRRPHVHALAPGVLAWIGCNGRGVALATAIGAQLARACLGEALERLPLPLSPLAPAWWHPLGRHLAGRAILYYRWRDARPLA